MNPALTGILFVCTINLTIGSLAHASTPDEEELDTIEDLYWAGDLDEALTRAEAFLADHPDHVEATAWKGCTLGSMAAEATATSDQARYGLAAISELRTALRRDPDCAVALIGMGYVKLETPTQYGGDLDEAIRYVHEAMERTTEPRLLAACHVALAEAYIGKKQRERGVAELETALEIAPDHRSARELLQGLRAYRPDARIEAIAVHGNVRTRREFILRGLTFEVGDVLDVDELDENEARWRASDHFGEFSISVRAIHSDEHVVVDIQVTEHAHVEWGVWPARIEHTHLAGRRHSAGVEIYLDKEWETEVLDKPFLWGKVNYGIAAHPTVGIGLDAQAGYMFFPYITRSGDAEGAEHLSMYDLHTGWMRADLSYAISDVVTVGVRDRLNYFHISGLQQTAGDPYFFPTDDSYLDNLVTAYVALHWTLGRTRPVTDLEIRLEETLAETSLGAKHDFSQTRVSAISRWHLARKATLVVRLEGGTSFGSIPHWQQFSIGGDLGLRGYTVFDHVGTRMALFTAELRLDVLTLLNGNMVFELAPLFDIGDAFTEGEAFSFDVSRYPFDYGLALNLHTAPGRTYRVGMHATFNREGEFNFVVSLYSPI